MKKKIEVFITIIMISFIYAGILRMFFRSFSVMSAMSSEKQESVPLPVIMYHSVLKDPAMSGKYVVTPSLLTRDIQYLKKNGYTFVSCADLIEYTSSDKDLPEKSVLLTFDDGFYNNYGYVKQILREQDANAVISVVGSYVDEYSKSNIANMTYGYLRWSDINEMLTDAHIEIGNHSYAFHSSTQGRNGSKRNNNESKSDYETIFSADTQKMQNEFFSHTQTSPVIYTYPFGAYSDETTDILKRMGFKLSFTCTEGINNITRDPNSLFLLKRYNRPSGTSPEEFFRKIIE